MQVPPQISFRHMDPSPAIEAHIMRRIDALEKIFPNMIGCQVVIDASQKKRVTGRNFEVSIQAELPGPDIFAKEKLGRSSAPEDVNLAVHRAFDQAERLLRERFEKMGNVETKHHPEALDGEVVRLMKEEGYGFIRGVDGNEYYFQQDGLTSGHWSDLDIGSRLSFKGQNGDKGMFAISVSPA